MISALSSMFRQAVKRGRSTGMKINPCLGMDKAHEADPNANREWFPEEWPVAFQRAPMEIKIPLMLARYGGLRGQSIVVVGWKQYRPDELTGMCFRFVTRKNQRGLYLPAMQELQDFLAGLSRSSTLIAVRDDGTPWPSEKEMQTRVSHYLRDLERAGLIGAGTTLHGLHHPARPARLLCRVVEAHRRRQQLGGGRPAGRQVGAHGQALYPARRGGGERHPGLHAGEGRKVNRFCTVLENGSADLENIRCPEAKTL
jgi:hypothetical protein